MIVSPSLAIVLSVLLEVMLTDVMLGEVASMVKLGSERYAVLPALSCTVSEQFEKVPSVRLLSVIMLLPATAVDEILEQLPL